MERLVLWHRVLPPAREEDDQPAAVAAWSRGVAERMHAAGGQVLGTLGSAVAAAFDLPDVADGIDLVLRLLDEAEALASPAGGLPVAVGGALGDIELVHDARGERIGFSGAVLDRAQMLANRAKAGELVLDAGARDASSSLYLFGRQVGSGAGSLRGQAIDRQQPRREACRSLVRHLRPAPPAPLTEEVLAPVRALLEAPGVRRVVLRGPPGAGAGAWLAALEREVEPPLVLRLAGVPAALEPLGSLRRALCRCWRSPSAVAAAVEAMGIAKADCETLTRLAAGDAVRRTEAVGALQELLSGVAIGGDTPWIVLDPVSGIDPGTLEVLSAVLDAPGAVALLVARLALDGQMPEALARPQSVEVVLPAMRSADARRVAEVVLGDEPGSEVALRVAVLGGDTVLGVEEAARTLVASGDLVYQGHRFEWRVGPRAGVRAIPTEALIDERLGGLAHDAHRVLEAACMAPVGAGQEIIEHVARADGLSSNACRESMERLRLEAFLGERGHPTPTSETLRQVVLQSMPPSRSAELQRFLATALRRESQGRFASGTVGYCLAEGGQVAEGARALLEAAQAALEAGFTRSAVRLAAAAVQFDPSQDTRASASAISRSLSRRVSAPPQSARSAAMDQAGANGGSAPELPEARALGDRMVRAIIQRDFDSAERFIDMAIAEGCDRPAAERIRALALLARGDASAAMQALARSHGQEEDEPRRAARAAITRALVQMHGGDPGEAVRPALEALAWVRQLRDPRGEAAALHVLAACYRALGRGADAEAIEDASPA
jgi:tetratricopeptide (TPR) repeat protein